MISFRFQFILKLWFSSRWYICARTEKPVIMCSIQSLWSFPTFPLARNSFNVRLTLTKALGSCSFKEDRLASASLSTPLSHTEAIDGMMFLALCRHVVSQALQHIKSSEAQAICAGCAGWNRLISLWLRLPGQFRREPRVEPEPHPPPPPPTSTPPSFPPAKSFHFRFQFRLHVVIVSSVRFQMPDAGCLSHSPSPVSVAAVPARGDRWSLRQFSRGRDSVSPTGPPWGSGGAPAG